MICGLGVKQVKNTVNKCKEVTIEADVDESDETITRKAGQP